MNSTVDDNPAKRLVIAGAGGHGRVVADIALAMGRSILGFIDDNAAGVPLADLTVIGRIADARDLAANGDIDFILAIGDNALRYVLSLRYPRLPWAVLVHPSAVISRYAEIGPGTVVMPNVVINAGARIGAHVILNTSCSVDHDCLVEDYAHLSPGVRLAGNVRVGPGTHMGTGAVAVPGMVIGDWTCIGAGAVVTKNVPGLAVAAGIPARVIRRLPNPALSGDGE